LKNWSRKLIWQIEWDDRARKELRKLDFSIQKEIFYYLQDRILKSDNPRDFGQNLSANKVGLWRYRVGDYRLICILENHNFVVLVISIGHRKEIYDD
jgi:mRNA interferase RelE/StbE